MRKLLVVAAAVPLLVALGQAGPAGAAGGGVRWEMNEPAGATVMHDTLGVPNNGSIPRSVSTGKGYYHFSGQGPVTVPDQAELSPGTRDFDVFVRLRFAKPGEYNIVQKAGWGPKQWKIDVTYKLVNCVIDEHINVVSHPLAGTGWHTIGCSKRKNAIILRIDGKIARTLYKPTDVVGKPRVPVTVGGKPTWCRSVSEGCDNYTGDLDWVRLTYP